LNAAQAIDLRRPLATSKPLEDLWATFREEVAVMNEDRVLHDDMILAEQFLNNDPSKWLAE